jgi:hypothetical protein
MPANFYLARAEPVKRRVSTRTWRGDIRPARVTVLVCRPVFLRRILGNTNGKSRKWGRAAITSQRRNGKRHQKWDRWLLAKLIASEGQARSQTPDGREQGTDHGQRGPEHEWVTTVSRSKDSCHCLSIMCNLSGGWLVRLELA